MRRRLWWEGREGCRACGSRWMLLPLLLLRGGLRSELSGPEQRGRGSWNHVTLSWGFMGASWGVKERRCPPSYPRLGRAGHSEWVRGDPAQRPPSHGREARSPKRVHRAQDGQRASKSELGLWLRCSCCNQTRQRPTAAAGLELREEGPGPAC